MSNLTNFNEIKNKIEETKNILSKSFLTKSEKKTLRKLKIYFIKETANIKKYKEINRENLFTSQKKIKELKIAPNFVILKEFIFMSFPIFFLMLFKFIEESPQENINTIKSELTIINFETLKSFIKLSSLLGGFISGFHCINRMIPAHTELKRIHHLIKHFEKQLEDLSQLVKKETLLSDLEILNSHLKKIDTVGFAKATLFYNIATNDQFIEIGSQKKYNFK